MGIPEISISDAKKLLDEGKAVFVDIRDPGSYGAGRIPGAKALNDGNIGAFVQDTPKDSSVVVCCYHGNSSKNATAYLLQQGFTDVASLTGGFESWKLQYEVERG